MACSFCSLKVLFIVLLISCTLFVVSLILAFVAFPAVIDVEIDKATKLEVDTEQYDRFLELPFPLDFKIYVFNVDNPDEVMNGTAKPILTEIGPYVYKQYLKKTIVSTDEAEDTISYTQTHTFEFDAEASGNLTEDDVVTVLNAPLMSIYQLAEDFLLAGGVEGCIKSTFPPGLDEMFIKIPVRSLFFEGINFCNNQGEGMCALVNDIVCGIAATKRNAETMPDYSLQFSFFNYKVKEPDGKYTVNRGLKDIELLGEIMSWNDMKYTNYWGDQTTCSEVKGTDSTLYPPRITEDSTFYIFSTDICRFVQIDYIGEGSYQDIDGYVFGTNKRTLYSSTENETDNCYCSMLTKDADGQKSCFLDGVIDMQTCFGAPVLFSFPHFLWADQKYLDAVVGLSPNEDLHKIYLIIEPNTGTPLKGVKRIQLNAAIRPIVGIKSMSQVSRAILPILWIEEGVSLTDEYVDKLNTSYFDKVQMVDGVRYALIGIFAALSVVFGGLTVRKRIKSKQYKE